jgi:hypothetical protein
MRTDRQALLAAAVLVLTRVPYGLSPKVAMEAADELWRRLEDHERVLGQLKPEGARC